MAPLVRHRPKGYAAPQTPVPWYEATVAYLIVVPGVLTWPIGLILYLTQSACQDSTAEQCSGLSLVSTTGSLTGILHVVQVLYVLAFLGATATQLTMRKLHYVIVWSIALFTLVCSLLAIGVITGVVDTPWGGLYDPTREDR
jgi:hypothetical protein